MTNEQLVARLRNLAGWLENGCEARHAARECRLMAHELATPINQCDGCRRGLPTNERGQHTDRYGRADMTCTADRYQTCSNCSRSPCAGFGGCNAVSAGVGK